MNTQEVRDRDRYPNGLKPVGVQVRRTRARAEGIAQNALRQLGMHQDNDHIWRFNSMNHVLNCLPASFIDWPGIEDMPQPSFAIKTQVAAAAADAAQAKRAAAAAAGGSTAPDGNHGDNR